MGLCCICCLDINGLIMTVDEDSGLLRVHTKEVFAELEKSKIDNTIESNNNLASLGVVEALIMVMQVLNQWLLKFLKFFFKILQI